MPHKREPGGPTFAYGDKNKYEVCEITDCWIWWGAYNRKTRRGKIRDGKRTLEAYVYFWQKRHRRKVPTGYMVAHLCENSICVNPAHLEAVQSFENCPVNQWHSDYYGSLSDIPF